MSKPNGDANVVAKGYPTPWIKCSVCHGTGYSFTSRNINYQDRTRGVVASMTKEKCKYCLGHGIAEYLGNK